MPEFMSKLLLLIEESKGWLTSILLPIYIVCGLSFSLMFGVASDQNKGKWKAALILLAVVVIMSAAIGYVLPWLYSFFA
ncbi:hypothetical protein P1O00_02360 [Erysipelothrix rhusiopathiae]|nr:hypothetical protein [Erysipelothrix rhusiopathiae]MDE9418837.1 hypothetical protein [Erysipelothrix rhusiopathiae]